MNESYRDLLDRMRQDNDARRAHAEATLSKSRAIEEHLLAIEHLLADESSPPLDPAQNSRGTSVRNAIETLLKSKALLRFSASDLTQHLLGNATNKSRDTLRPQVANVLKRMHDDKLLVRRNRSGGVAQRYQYWLTPEGARAIINGTGISGNGAAGGSDEIPINPILSVLAWKTMDDLDRQFVPGLLESATLIRTNPMTVQLKVAHPTAFQREQLAQPLVRELIRNVIRQVLPEIVDVEFTKMA